MVRTDHVNRKDVNVLADGAGTIVVSRDRSLVMQMYREWMMRAPQADFSAPLLSDADLDEMLNTPLPLTAQAAPREEFPNPGVLVAAARAVESREHSPEHSPNHRQENRRATRSQGLPLFDEHDDDELLEL